MASVNVNSDAKFGQLSLFPTEMEQIALDITETYGTNTVVDIPKLRKENPRLDLAAKIAEQNHFMHWELEFADLFAERGGFDLIIGNPPWIKITWNEQGVLSDANPMFAVKKLNATQTTHERAEALESDATRMMYFAEYESVSGEQSFLGAVQNYPDLKGAVNLYKCFLPLAWEKNNERGCAAFVHPEGVYDDPKGGALREKLYPRLRYHFQFANERKLFPEVDHHTTFSLNVYGGPLMVSFDTISNLYDAKSIVECYEGDTAAPIPGIKDDNGEWNTKGHPDRIIHVMRKELTVFAKLFDGSNEWKQAKLPVLHVKQIVTVLEIFNEQTKTYAGIKEGIFTSQLWNETGAQNDGTIARNVHFPDGLIDMIYSGPHISVANPMFKTSRRICNLNSDYDNVDLCIVNEEYLQRCNYVPVADMSTYVTRIPKCGNEKSITSDYHIAFRRMLNQGGERTLIGTIVPPKTSHISTVISLIVPRDDLLKTSAEVASIPYDALVKILGKGDIYADTIEKFPIVKFANDAEAESRIAMLTALNKYYDQLWSETFNKNWALCCWAKSDPRLANSRFSSLTSEWTWDTPLRTDYERRQALVEIDVLTAMALGMTLQQLKTIYRIQFPVLQSYEADTWYDANGRIVFTNNRSLTGVGYSRPEFENAGAVQPTTRGANQWDGIMKNAPAGYVFSRTITDDTQPGGPVERTIEYVAPFDRCDREQDYETAWKFFEEKYTER